MPCAYNWDVLLSHDFAPLTLWLIYLSQSVARNYDELSLGCLCSLGGSFNVTFLRLCRGWWLRIARKDSWLHTFKYNWRQKDIQAFFNIRWEILNPLYGFINGMVV